MRSTLSRTGYRGLTLLLHTAIALTFLSGRALAGDTYWQHDPATPGDWLLADNWNNGLPDSTTRAYINNGGEVQLTTGSARTRYLHLGHTGVGSMVQSEGTLRIAERAFIGHEVGGNGRYELVDGDFLALGGMLLGRYGTGDFIQRGGTATIGGIWIAGYYGSGSGSGAYRQTGGVNNAGAVSIYDNGAYELTGAAVLNVDFVGAYGPFTQTGGTNNAGRISSHGYTITAGLLETGELTVGEDPNYGPGRFVQDGFGSSVTVNGKLFVGHGGGNNGEYVFDKGALTVNGQEYVGYQGAQGVFKQSGGTHIVDDLSVRTFYGNTSRFELSGGSLRVRRSIDLQDGELSFPGPGGTLNFDDQASADLARGTIQNAANGTVNGGSQSLIVFPPGFDPYSQLASFTNPGHTHIAGGPLSLPSGKSVHFVGAIDDPVTCEGSLVGSYSVNTGLIVRGSGHVDAGDGSITIQDHVSRIEGGSIAARTLKVGFGTLGTFRHLGGAVSIADRVTIQTVGDDPWAPIPSGTVTYELAPGGVLSANITEIAYNGGTAKFVQTGGIHKVDSVYVTQYTYHSSRGSYDMSDGELQVAKTLWVGGRGDSAATFSMTDGAVTADTILVAINGSTSSFVQDGGSVEATTVSIASSRYAAAEGTYSISGGSLFVGALELGAASKGEGRLEVFGGEATITVTGEFRQEALGTLLSVVGPDGLSEIECATAEFAGSWSVLDNGAPFGRFSVVHATGGASGTFTSVDLPGPYWSWGIDGGTTVWVEHVPAVLSLLVDIRPGSDINPVNLTSQGVLPVAIYGSDQVDVELIDLNSLLLEGTSPRQKGKSGNVGRFEDINGDLIVDLLLHFDMRDLDIDGTAEEFILSGVLLDGTALEGADSVRMVPLGDANADLKVDILDLTNLAANWGRSGGWHKSDFNDDGVVDIIDLTATAANWGYDGTANGAIPEPASATLLAIGLSGLMWRRRRR